MKTPIQDILEYIQETHHLKLSDNRQIELLEKEKQIIIDAYVKACDWHETPKEDAEKYFNQTFNNK